MSVLSNCRYVIFSDQPNVVQDILVYSKAFSDFKYEGSANELTAALDMVIEKAPDLIFLALSHQFGRASLSWQLLTDLKRYLVTLPKIVILANDMQYAVDAIQHEVFEFIVFPLRNVDIQKVFLKYRKNISHHTSSIPFTANGYGGKAVLNDILKDESSQLDIQIGSPEDSPKEESFDNEHAVNEHEEDVSSSPTNSEITHTDKPLVICVKSYGDYRFINANEICYLKADNNSTDIHLVNGEMITAFKTLKHFEHVLQSPFVRIHNSYIVNIDFVARIHTGNSACYLKHNGLKLPFSKSYKENVDTILVNITKGNYLEI